ncbi:hypothetical protein Tco_0241432 [Tanacetum coccineum]
MVDHNLQSRLELSNEQNTITHEITVLVKDLLMPLAEKTRVNSSEFERVLKEEMFDDLQYFQSLEKELDKLQFDKNEFSNEYDLLFQEVIHNTSVSRPQLRSNQVKDKVVQNNSQVKIKQKEVEDHWGEDEFTLPATCVRTHDHKQHQSIKAWAKLDGQLATDPDMCIVRALPKGYAQEEGIDFEESFAPVSRLEVAKYALEILKKHGMEKGQNIGTPMATKPKLNAELSGKLTDQTDYHSKISSLMYLTFSRPDIVQAVCYCARYQARPTEKHLKEVKIIFRYLRCTINMGLWYPKDSGFKLTAFSDAYHVECIDTRKSTSAGIQFLGDKLVSWMPKKQDYTAMLSTEAEHMVLSTSCAQVMGMRTQLKHSHTKYIHTRYHFIKEQVENSIIKLYFVRTEYQLADMFTKALLEDRFQYLVKRIGMRCLTPSELEVLTNESA